MREKTLKIIGVAVAVVLIAAWAAMVITDKQQEKERQKAYQSYEMRAQPYRIEIGELERRMQELHREAPYYGGASRLMLGFAVSDVADVECVRALEAAYCFTPILIVDSACDEEAMQSVAEAIDPTWEAMLYAPSLRRQAVGALVSARSTLARAGRSDCGVVFCRTESVTDEELQDLHRAGLAGVTVFHESPKSGQFANGMVYFDYFRITEKDMPIQDKLSLCGANRSSLLFVFDMDSLRDNGRCDEIIGSYLDEIIAFSKGAGGLLSRASEAVEALSECNSIIAEQDVALAAERNALQSQMDALKQRINDIYTECFAGIQG